MPESVQFWLLVAALLVLGMLIGVHSYLLLKLMGEIEKFGRLLLKVRRRVKAADHALDARTAAAGPNGPYRAADDARDN